MRLVSSDELREESYVHLLRNVYNDRPHISMYSIRMMLVVTFGVTATDATMLLFMWFLPRQGLGRRLRQKTSHDAPIVVAVVDLSPYLDLLYVRIADDPSITVQRLSAYFVAEHCIFC